MEDQPFKPSINDRLFVLTQELTPNLLDLYIKDASPQASGQLGHLYEIYYKIRQFDSRIGSAIDKRIDNITQLEWQVSGDEADIVTGFLNKMRFSQLVEDLMDGKFMGASVFQIPWKEYEGFMVPCHPWQIPYSRLYMGSQKDKEDFGKIFISEGKLTGNQTGTVIDELVEEHPHLFIVATNRDKDGFYDVSGILKSILHLYIIKYYALVFWMQYAEKYGEPYMLGKLAVNDFKQYKRDMEKALKNVGRDRYGVVVDTMDIEAIATQGTPEIYKQLIDYVDESATIKILGNNLTSKVDGGSYSAALVHDAGEKRKLISDSTWLAEIINDQIITPFMLVNRPSVKDSDYPSFEFNLPTSSAQQLEEIRKLKELSQVVPVAKSEFYRLAGTRPPEEGEETVESAAFSSLRDIGT
jgi:phage gp29-like protein